jgi:hypothetical protein
MHKHREHLWDPSTRGYDPPVPLTALFLVFLAAAPAPKARPTVAGWTVQVASTASKEEAQRLVTVLVGRDAPAWLAATEVSGKTLYRVRVGHFPDKEKAKTFADGLVEELHLTYWIAPDDVGPLVTATTTQTTTLTPVSTATARAQKTPASSPAQAATPPATPTPEALPSEALPSASEILSAAIAAHGGAQGGLEAVDHASSISLRYRLKSLDAKTGEPVFTRHVYLRKGGDRSRLEIEPMAGVTDEANRESGPASATVATPKGAWVDSAGRHTALTLPSARARIESLGAAGILRLPLEFPQKGTAAAGFTGAKVAGTRTLNGEQVLRIDASPPPASYREASLYFDPVTHLMVAARFLTDAGELLLAFGDYRTVAEGLVVPFHRMVYRDGVVVSSVELDEFLLGAPIDDSEFTR